ncbi:helix-turn-helix domain-containing protein [Nonomuraea sp. NPDC050310]|uniref:helix-turn-helix domain-containing protein n=1 Tax=Nonomuraea sp. NPDC050310 TaxID=3154935 RepID=UPI0033FF5B84
MVWQDVRTDRELRRAVEDLSDPLRERLTESGRSQEWLARATSYSPSSISRALSGRVLPSREVVVAISEALKQSPKDTARRWRRAANLRRTDRREQRTAELSGWPPHIRTYEDLLGAVRRLISRSAVTQTRLAERIGVPPSTLSAALRGTRSLHRQLLEDVIHAWQGETGAVSRAAVARQQIEQWLRAWDQVGRPYQQQRLARRQDGYRRSGEARRTGLAILYERRRQHGAWLRELEAVPRRRVRRRRPPR